MNLLRRTGASLFFLGYFPFASGTLGSAVTVLLIWFVNLKYPFFFSSANIAYQWIAIMTVIAISIFLSSKSKDIFGSNDPSPVIIDELAGQLITFFLIPLSAKTLIAGFVLFRFFDIVKPFPVHNMEEIEGGVGITMDDVAAGIYANLSLLITLTLYHYVKAYL